MKSTVIFILFSSLLIFNLGVTFGQVENDQQLTDISDKIESKQLELDSDKEVSGEKLVELKEYISYLEELLKNNQVNYNENELGQGLVIQEELKSKLALLKFKVEAKEKEVKAEQEKNKYLTYIIVFLALFLIPTILAIIFFIHNKKTKKSNVVLDDQNTKLTKAYNNIQSSIKYAERIQKSVLVKPEVINEYFKESFILWKPKDIVSGDFYYFTEAGNKLIITAVDCTGHGVPGAFMTIMGNSFLNEIIIEHGVTQPAAILTELHTKIQESLSKGDQQADDGMDIALACIDKDKKTIAFAGANNPMFYIGNNELHVVNANRGGLGGTKVYKEIKYDNNEIDISDVDTFYLFSDGFHDQFGGEEDRKFMKKRFKQLLLDNQKKTLAQQHDILEKEINLWQGEVEQTDDILVIGVKL